MDPKPLYTPLSGTKPLRFVHLLPGEPSAPISVELVHAHLDQPTTPSYEAVSYTWGDPTITETIQVDNSVLSVTRNAAAGLRRFRFYDRARLLWMDAICINQKDDEERAKQVDFMHEIYAQATCVLVWLGEGSVEEDSALALDFVRGLHPTQYLNEFWQLIFGSMEQKDTTCLWDVLQVGEDSRRLVTALRKLLYRPWLRRVWIQQETSVCKNMIVFCGEEETVAWDQFCSLAWLFTPKSGKSTPEWLNKHLLQVEAMANAMISIQLNRASVYDGTLQETSGEKYQLRRSYPILAFMVSTWACLATDPRDKIFAIMNLPAVGLEAVPLLRVDYTIPWQLLYYNFAKWICQAGELEMILNAGRTKQQGRELPSWVPDWRDMISSYYIRYWWHAGGPQTAQSTPVFHDISMTCGYGDSASSPPNHTTRSDGLEEPLVLAIELVCIMQDCIVFTSGVSKGLVEHGTASFPQHAHQVLEYNNTSISFIQDLLPRCYITGESTKHAYHCTLITDITHNNEQASADYVARGAEWALWLERGASGESLMYHKAILDTETFDNKRFSVTARGYMCLVPEMSRPGDIVAIISGVTAPVVLRRTTSGNAELKPFELLGNAYVHGMMNGEACNLIEKYDCKFRGDPENSILENATSVLPYVEQDVEVYEDYGVQEAMGSDDDTGDVEDVESDDEDDNLAGYRPILATLGERQIILV
jgi:hypothetical protein